MSLFYFYDYIMVKKNILQNYKINKKHTFHQYCQNDLILPL